MDQEKAVADKTKEERLAFEEGQIRGYREASATALRRATIAFQDGKDVTARALRELSKEFADTAQQLTELLESRKG